MIQITSKKYVDYAGRETSFYLGNVLDKKTTMEIEFNATFSITLSFATTVLKSGATLSLTNGAWSDSGFVAGKTISGTIKDALGTSYTIDAGITITYINGGIMTLSADPLAGSSGPDGEYTQGTITVNSPIDSIEFYFNLVDNSVSGGPASSIDSEVNKFHIDSSSFTVGDNGIFDQVGNKSGGSIMFATLDMLDDSPNKYRISVEFQNWMIQQSSYQADACVKPWIQIDILPQYNNPSAKKSIVSTEEANSGYFNENFNGLPAAFSFNGITWTDNDGNLMDGPDHTQESNFEAEIGGTFTGSSKFNIGWIYNPADATIYQNKPTPFNNNFMEASAEGVLSLGSSPTIVGNLNEEGVGVELKNLNFAYSGSILTVIGKVAPTAGFADYIEGKPNDRGCKMWVRCESPSLSDTFINPVNLLIVDQDMVKNPVLGVVFSPVEAGLVDHGGNTLTGDVPEIITEDDMYFGAAILLEENTLYDGINVGMVARETLNVEFLLESFNFSFEGKLMIAGKYTFSESSFTVPRNFNLPAASEKNVVRISRLPIIDTPGYYGILIDYGFLSRWEYWLPQPNVDNDFFDATQPFDGKNKNWQRFTAASWRPAVAVNIIKNGVEDFYRKEYFPRPYEYDTDVSASYVLERQDGTNVTALISGERINLQTEFVWDADLFSGDAWVEITIEDFEAGNRWLISSVLDGGETGNPLTPEIGQTKLILSGLGTDTLVTECVIDTDFIDAEKVSLTFRVHDKDMDYRKKVDVLVKKLPVQLLEENRGKENCCCTHFVFASLNSNDSYKNLVNSAWFVGESIEFVLKTCAGELTAFQPTAQLFPNDPNAKYCTIPWKDVLQSDGPGNYILSINYDVAGITGTYDWAEYELVEWLEDVITWQRIVNGLVMIRSIFNDANELEGIDFTNANVQDCIAFKGNINDFQPNMVTKNLQYRNNILNKIKREYLTRWVLSVSATTICTIDVVLKHLLAENTIYISDYNFYAYDKSMLERPFIVSQEGGGPKIENFGGSDKKGLTCEMDKKKRQDKTHFGSVNGSKQPNEAIPLLPNVVYNGGEPGHYYIIDQFNNIFADENGNRLVWQ